MLSAKQIPPLKATTDVWLEGLGQMHAREIESEFNQCNNLWGYNGPLSLYNARN